MRSSGPFSRRTLWVIVPIAVVSLLVTIVSTVIGTDPGSQQSAGADAYSRSAIGHRGLIALLERLDVPVLVSRTDSAQKAAGGVLVIVEPVIGVGGGAAARLRDQIGRAPRVLLVLPKWYGKADLERRWIDDSALIPVDELSPLFDALGVRATVARGHGPVRVHDTDNTLAAGPVVIDGAQTIHGEAISPVLDSDDGIVLGQTLIDGTIVTILADPDPINNVGLREPDNARFAVTLLDKLRGGGPVVFDEATHGFAPAPSLALALFRFPLVLATLQFLLCAILIVWAAMVRFGPVRAAPPPLAPGKDYLIHNTAALLRYGGHHGDTLRRYLAASIQAVRHALHAPADLGAAGLAIWLERVRIARGGRISLDELSAAVERSPATPHRVVELADLIHRWRQEMTHGPDHRS